MADRNDQIISPPTHTHTQTIHNLHRLHTSLTMKNNFCHSNSNFSVSHLPSTHAEPIYVSVICTISQMLFGREYHMIRIRVDSFALSLLLHPLPPPLSPRSLPLSHVVFLVNENEYVPTNCTAPHSTAHGMIQNVHLLII